MVKSGPLSDVISNSVTQTQECGYSKIIDRALNVNLKIKGKEIYKDITRFEAENEINVCFEEINNSKRISKMEKKIGLHN